MVVVGYSGDISKTLYIHDLFKAIWSSEHFDTFYLMVKEERKKEKKDGSGQNFSGKIDLDKPPGISL